MTENEILMSILQAGLKGDKLTIEDVNWQKMMALSLQQAISGFVYQVIDTNEMPAELKKKWKHSYLATLQKSMLFDAAFADIIQAAEANQMKLLCYKGSRIKYLYPDPTMRMMGDLDFLYETDKRDEVIKMMKSFDYQLEKEYGNQMIFKKAPYLVVEFHNTLHEDDLELKLYNDPFEKAKPLDGYQYVFEMDDTMHFMFIITHIYQHLVHGGAGIRNYMDLCLFYEKKYENIDFSLVEHEFQSVGLEKFYQVTIAFVLKAFDKSSEFSLSEELYTEYLKRIMQGGIYGQQDEAQFESMIQNSKKRSKIGHIFSRLFPQYSIMRAHFPVLKKKMMWIFLPWFYFWRFIKFVFSGRFRRKMKYITNKDESKTDLFVQEIGLRKD